MGESVKKGHEKSSPKGHESCNQRWKTTVEEKKRITVIPDGRTGTNKQKLKTE